VTSRLPAEWENQSALLFTWPHSKSHSDYLLHDVERLFIDVIRYVTDQQKVIISIHDQSTMDKFTSLPGYSDISQKNLEAYIVPSNDCWARDHGPVTIIEDENPVLLDFGFNGWNKKYPFKLDDEVTQELHARGAFGNTGLRSIDTVLEGGSIETNGNSWLFTTSSCLLQHNRNPGYDQNRFESVFSEFFGCEHKIWLQHGMITGDDTDGHIDTLLRFCSENLIVYQQCRDPAHMDYTSLKKMENQLIDFNNKYDQPFTLVPLPVPDKIFSPDKKPLPASYVNFIITNHMILMPGYEDINDKNAMSILQECFPGREVISINSLPLIMQFGSLHCTSMQLPAGVVA